MKNTPEDGTTQQGDEEIIIITQEEEEFNFIDWALERYSNF